MVTKLHNKKYFALKINSQKFVNKIYDDINVKLGSKKHKNTPTQLKKYGPYYSTFNTNKKTTWYVFFDKKEDVFFIQYITNNHLPISAHLKGI